MRLLKIALALTAILLTVARPITAQEDAEAFLMEIAEELELTEEQTGQLGALMAESAQMYKAASETSDSDDEEDPKKSLSEFKKAREHYLDGAAEIMTDEQFDAYQAYIDQEMTEMMKDVAEIKLLDMQPTYDLTDEQIEALKPPMAEGLKGILKIGYEYGDKKMNTRTKIKVGKSLKKIKSSMDTSMKSVMTDEQWAKLEADREAKKAEGS
jgi:hypothetical protein